MQDVRSSYDNLPYPSWPYQYSSPDHLSTVAFLLGFDPARASACRVLEIGCGSGNNLLPAAIRHPDSRFLGIDISAVQIASAKKSAERLGLTNIEFAEADFRTFERRFAPFDFVIVHGVFSWIASDAQGILLALCRKCLAPRRVIYISYNCYPGWKTREIFREAMLTRIAASPHDNPVGIARGMINFLRDHVPADSPLRGALDTDFALTAEADDAYFVHDFLEAEKNPIYLSAFN